MKDVIQKKLELYDPKDSVEELNAIKEITQELVLYGLQKAGLFKEASFLGGTCLRIIHDLDRFSEDLDFSTKVENSDFNLDPFLEKAMDIMGPYGYHLSIDQKDLSGKAVKSRFLKDDSIKKVLTFKHFQNESQKIKIKVEVDTRPPEGAVEMVSFIDFPTDFSISTYDLPSLMSGKLHALLCRPFVKGRDWYDFTWYVKKQVSPNLNLLAKALYQMGPWQEKDIGVDIDFVKQVLSERALSLDWNEVKSDVKVFLSKDKADEVEELWGINFFETKINKLK